MAHLVDDYGTRSRGTRVLVTGAAGQLGTAVVSAFGDAEVIAHTRSSLDITDAAAVARAVRDASPDAVINCAAYNDVDAAESFPIEALAVNAFAVRAMARAAADAGAAFVHYSTDFVFDGEARAPYAEDAPTSPLSTYGASKLLGEWFAFDVPRAYVLRVESLFGTPRGWSGRRGTLEGLVAGLEAGREMRAFSDRVVSPTYIVDAAAATRHLLQHGAAPGVYHCVNDGAATWYDIALEAAAVLGVKASLVPVTMAEIHLKAVRPRYCALSAGKLQRAGYSMPPWNDALRRWVAARGEAAA
jgi:dTDP-4-dehydrorhamnose reductase